MKYLMIAACVVAAGCATTPRTIGECDVLFFSMEEVRACEKRVIRYEDLLFKRRETELRRQQCLIPNWWDGSNGRCRLGRWL